MSYFTDWLNGDFVRGMLAERILRDAEKNLEAPHMASLGAVVMGPGLTLRVQAPVQEADAGLAVPSGAATRATAWASFVERKRKLFFQEEQRFVAQDATRGRKRELGDRGSDDGGDSGDLYLAPSIRSYGSKSKRERVGDRTVLQLSKLAPTKSEAKVNRIARWTKDEDDALRGSVMAAMTRGSSVGDWSLPDWDRVASLCFSSPWKRTGKDCAKRWSTVLSPGLKKGAFTAEEDRAIVAAVWAQCGTQCGTSLNVSDSSSSAILAAVRSVNWSEVAAAVPRRLPKQCRDRWANHVNPALDLRKAWTQEEDQALLDARNASPPLR